MIRRIVVTGILRIISIALQLFFIKKISNGFTIIELGEYYFHLAITFVYQFLFFTPFILKYQRRFRVAKKPINVLRHLGEKRITILFHCVLFLIFSLPILAKSSLGVICLFLILSLTNFVMSMFTAYFILIGSSELSQFMILSELVIRDLVIGLILTKLDIVSVAALITFSNVLTIIIFGCLFISKDFSLRRKYLGFRRECVASLKFSISNINIVFAAGSNYIQNNLYKWILAFNGDFNLLGSVTSVMGLGQQIETNMINVFHNVFITRIFKSSFKRLCFYMGLIGFTAIILLLIYPFKEVIIGWLLNVSLKEYGWFILIGIVYELINYFIGNHSLLKCINRRYLLNNLYSLIFAVGVYLTAMIYCGINRQSLMVAFLIPSIFTLVLLMVNSDETKNNI